MEQAPWVRAKAWSISAPSVEAKSSRDIWVSVEIELYLRRESTAATWRETSVA